ncbi:MAG: hypothetical protein Q8N99_01585 [Nanoarchaeota archaeon]|nr:hypothetical protein [Nanoarchaeota archaeon]
MNKKGQAAMEFLMTYGWAILAAVIAIGVLAYFGVFSPGKYLPNACTLNAPLGCDEYAVTNANGVQLVLRNGAGDSLAIVSVAVTNCGTDSTGWTVADGATQAITVTCAPALAVGDKFKGDVTITYRKSGGTLDQISSGTMTAKVA